MNVSVDQNVCIGASMCQKICPEVFKVEDGKSQVQKNPVPADLEDKVKQAEKDCPSGAISVS